MALSARRALQVLDFLTVNQRGTFTLSELSKALDVSPGSMFTILKTMTDEGYVVRHPSHKTYRLGPAIAASGRAASDTHPVIDLARAEMVNLAAATGHECSGTVLAGRDILCIAVEGKPTGKTLQLAPGQRVPLQPPLGQPFIAWMPPSEMTDRMALLPVELREQATAYIETFGPFVRSRGYSIGRDDSGPERLNLTRQLAEHPNDAHLRAQLLRQFLDDHPKYAVLDPEPDVEYNLGNIAAPVFDPEGRVAFCLTLLHIGTVKGHEISAAAQPVTASAQLLTRQIGGRPPNQDRTESA